jgi:hypothetical protein
MERFEMIGGVRAKVTETETEWSRRAKKRRAGRFLMIRYRDWPALKVAAALPGKAYVLLTLIYYRQAVTFPRRAMTNRRVTLPSMLLAEFGIGKNAKGRGLRQLENAGLIRTYGKPGHSVEIETVAKRR